MDGADLPTLVRVGELLFGTKFFMVSLHCMWLYDYLLTLGDEIKYAWSGRKSWGFALFISNRYTPVLHLVWVHTVMFRYTKPETKWIALFHTTAVTVLGQIAVALRIFAVTRRNKLLGGALSVMIAAQLGFGICFIIRVAMGPIQQIPEINLDAFKVCFYKRWPLGELLFVGLATAFDVLAFLIVVATAKRSRMNRYPGIPSTLDTILRDATVYFILMFACQLSAQLFFVLVPAQIQLMPAVAAVIFTPMMASRLMLSLKKAAMEPKRPQSLATITGVGTGGSPEHETIRFVPRIPSGYETPETPCPPNQGDIKFSSVLQ